MSSGLTSPFAPSASAPVAARSASIALTRSYVEASTIMSSSSTPTVHAGPVKLSRIAPERTRKGRSDAYDFATNQSQTERPARPARSVPTIVARLLIACLLLAALAVGSGLLDRGEAPDVSGSARGATVTRVVDGDTVILSGVGRSRLIGVDTPEVHGRRRVLRTRGVRVCRSPARRSARALRDRRRAARPLRSRARLPVARRRALRQRAARRGRLCAHAADRAQHPLRRAPAPA